MRLKICFILKIGVVFLLLSIPCRGRASSGGPGTVKIAVITDIHFLDTSLAAEGEALSAYEEATGRNIADLHAALDTVLADLAREAPDLLLVTGDITNHGEKQSHLGFIGRLRRLQDQGTRILVIPGNHDINIPDAKAYRGKLPTPCETVSKEEFAELYGPFGYAAALERDKNSLSYLAEINDSLWLLCFDTNRYDEHTATSITGGRILAGTMDWALGILAQAGEKGITVLGMMHHGLVEHMPFQAAFFPQYLVDGWERDAGILADAGLKVVFTGHFHANDITMHTSSAGNAVYDVETASLAHYPFAYRLMALSGDTLSGDTRFVESIPGNPSLAAVYRDKLAAMTRRAAESKLAGLGIPMPRETLDALTDVMVKLNLMHVRGDEKPDREIEAAIRLFAAQMGSEADTGSFTFDFPPEDNRVVIPLR